MEGSNETDTTHRIRNQIDWAIQSNKIQTQKSKTIPYISQKINNKNIQIDI